MSSNEGRGMLGPVLLGGAIFILGSAALSGVVVLGDRGGSEARAAGETIAATVPAPAAPASPAAATDEMAGMTMEAAASTDGAAAMGDHTSYHAPAKAGSGKLADAPYDPVLPALEPGPVKDITLALKDVTLEIAPGVHYRGWTFAGGAPGPVIHVRQGQKVRITLRNDGAIPHSIDFHAARIAPSKAFVDVKPGESFTYEFTANDPGVFMYHCGTPPVLAHIANGMYGAIVVDPATPLPKADREYVLVGSEWYLSNDGKTEPAAIDMAKARHMEPDYVTWNGFAGQYKDFPLVAERGERVRFYVVAAGPSFDLDFHVVGTLLDRAYVDGTTTNVWKNVQTMLVPAGGGMVFDTHFDEDGLYPVVSHSFASVDLGQVGLVRVGDATGTMSH